MSDNCKLHNIGILTVIVAVTKQSFLVLNFGNFERDESKSSMHPSLFLLPVTYKASVRSFTVRSKACL